MGRPTGDGFTRLVPYRGVNLVAALVLVLLVASACATGQYRVAGPFTEEEMKFLSRTGGPDVYRYGLDLDQDGEVDASWRSDVGRAYRSAAVGYLDAMYVVCRLIHAKSTEEGWTPAQAIDWLVFWGFLEGSAESRAGSAVVYLCPEWRAEYDPIVPPLGSDLPHPRVR